LHRFFEQFVIHGNSNKIEYLLMDRNFRRQTLVKLAQMVGGGPVTQKILQALPPEAAAPKKTTYAQTFSMPGGEAQIHIPANAVDPQTGTYNVVIHFKGRAGNIGKAGLNSVVITANRAPGKQFAQHFRQAYAGKDFVNRALASVQSRMQSQNPNARLGQWGLSSFSGGSGAAASIYSKEEYDKSKFGDPRFVFFNDALHASDRSIDKWKALAEKAKQNPAGTQLIISHADVPRPAPHVWSTREVGDELTRSLDLQYQTPASWAYTDERSVRPVGIASEGGMHVVRMHDESSSLSPRDQHLQMLGAGGSDVLAQFLPDWRR
jgi:hypothetical protein